MEITQTITTIPTAGHRGVDSRDTFVTKQEAFQDALTATTVTELNTFVSQANAVRDEVNTARDDAIAAKEIAETARDEAVGAVATLPDGIINDSITSPTDTWSSEKIATAVEYVEGLIPSQTGNAGKALVTDGTTTAWSEIKTNTKPYEILAIKSIPFDYVNSTTFAELFPKALELENGKFFIYGTPNGSGTAVAFIYDSVANTVGMTTVVASSTKAISKAVKINSTSVLFISSAGTALYYKILTIDGENISVGTTSTIALSANIILASSDQDCGIEVTELDTGKYILSYTDANAYVWVQGFTLEGDTVTFGTAVNFITSDGNSADKAVVFKISTTKAAIFTSNTSSLGMRIISIVDNVLTSLAYTVTAPLSGRFIAYQLPSGRFACVYNTININTNATLFTYNGVSTISVSTSNGVITDMHFSGILLQQVGNTILLAGSTSTENTKCTAITDTGGVFTRVNFPKPTSIINYGVYLVGRRQDGMFFRIKTTTNCFQIYKLEYKNDTASLIHAAALGFSVLDDSSASPLQTSYNTEDNNLVSLEGNTWSLCLGGSSDRCVFVSDTQVLSEFTPLGFPLLKSASCRLYNDTALLFIASIKANTYEIQVIKVL